ncbi:hypothetical protein KY284_001006 [Solanum tuberosum]|nr:hypothetical protein KY284_001006 [Solanum tuberosum]
MLSGLYGASRGLISHVTVGATLGHANKIQLVRDTKAIKDDSQKEDLWRWVAGYITEQWVDVDLNLANQGSPLHDSQFSMPHRPNSEYPREGEVHVGRTTTTRLVELTHISIFSLADSTPDLGGFQTEMATLRVDVDALATSTASAPDPSPTEAGDEVLASLFGDIDPRRALRKRTLTFDDTIDGAEDWCTKNKERHKFEASQ